MKLTLKKKIIGLAVVAAVLPVLVISLLILVQKRALMVTLAEEANAISRNDTAGTVQLVYHLCQMTDRQVESRLREHLAGAVAELARHGPVSLGTNLVAWEATNQFNSQQVARLRLPALRVGDQALLPNWDAQVESPLVDALKRYTGADCTILQRMGADGGLLRIATSLPAADGRRALGMYLPRHLADGSEHPVVASVLRGEVYVERAYGLGRWQAAIYQPLWDSAAGKEVVGVLVLGLNLDELSRALRQAILSIKVGRTGYVYVLGAKGDDRGHYLISKEGKSDGLNLWESKDPGGHYFIQAIISKALQTTNGASDFERYPWRNPDETVPRMKVAAVTYFAPWDWVIAAGMYEDDYQSGFVARLERGANQLLRVGPLGGAVVALLMAGLALVLGRAIVKPVTRTIQVSRIIAEGNLADAGKEIEAMKTHVDTAGTDEPSQLFAAVSTMTGRLTSLVGQMQRSSVALVSTATQIAAASRQQEATVTEFGASTNEVTAAVKEISATSQELAKTMDDVKRVAVETETLSDRGRSGLTEMESSMRRLAQATAAISARLAVMNEKANNINTLVTTITKVADQTNLLSLNASIEAEKAGEYGLGFAVVAREIRRLADQTAVASLDIEQTVREMQSCVTAGVMEMDKFTSEVTQGVQAVNEIAAQMGRIIAQVEVLMPRFDSVNEGMRAQSDGARQISEAMVQLNEGAHNATESLRQFKSATEQLKESARLLQQETGRFKV
jgi:methyl-accepting chemotaxis protein WspA